MNILHLIDEPYDSGIVHYALTAARGLRERGHGVAVAGLLGRPPIAQAARMGLQTFGLLPWPMGWLALRRALRGGSWSLINAHTGSAHAWAAAAGRTLPVPIPLVRTRADARPARRTPGARLLWRRTAGFIAASGRILEEFRSAFRGLEPPARAIPPAIDDPHPDDEPVSPPDTPLRIGIVGRLDPVKGHIVLLRAASKLLREAPDAMFVIAGREENLRAWQLRSAAAAFGVARSVEFLGHVPDPFDIMRLCHIGVVASVGSEAVSRVALEWMSMGRPLVAGAVGCLPELIQEGKTGFLVPPNQPEALADRLASLIRNRDLRVRLGLAARARFKDHFLPRRLALETEEFYESILSRLSRATA